MDETMTEPQRTVPFAPFEWLLSGRYLRARRKEGFISVIAGFSFLGIMLGVATLIVVMAVLNGFRRNCWTRSSASMAISWCSRWNRR
jgi:lipoprotein-releasing system permease protein